MGWRLRLSLRFPFPPVQFQVDPTTNNNHTSHPTTTRRLRVQAQQHHQHWPPKVHIQFEGVSLTFVASLLSLSWSVTWYLLRPSDIARPVDEATHTKYEIPNPTIITKKTHQIEKPNLPSGPPPSSRQRPWVSAVHPAAEVSTLTRSALPLHPHPP